MTYDNKILKGRIVTVFGTQEAFGKAMGWDNSKTSLRLSNLNVWRLQEIKKAARVLKIKPSEVHYYFFTN